MVPGRDAGHAAAVTKQRWGQSWPPDNQMKLRWARHAFAQLVFHTTRSLSLIRLDFAGFALPAGSKKEASRR
jgi:hypothetical protein